jgi:ABC-2 type transport system permease protein
VADPLAGPDAHLRPGAREDAGPPWRPYLELLRSRVAAQTGYRGSFALDLLGNVGIGLVELSEIYVIFSRVDALGGLDVGGALLVFALANVAFSLADLAVGHVDTLPTYLRAGTLDAFLLRPLPVLAQLATSDISLKRLGRTALAVVVLAVAVPAAVSAWTPAKVLLLVVTPFVGAAVFAALFVVAAALQFWLVEGSELTNSFTYGGAYAASYPASVFPLPLRVLFSFVVPAAFTAYLPALALMDEPGPPWLPSWLGWCTPLAAGAAWGVSLLVWRAGLRHHTGAGG